MMDLKNILSEIQKKGGSVTVKGFVIKIKIDRTRFTLDARPNLYELLNNFEDLYFIIITGLPFCVLPDAHEHLIYDNVDGKDCDKDKMCEKCSCAITCPGWGRSLSKINRDKIGPVYDKPREIVIEITNRCNVRCQVCTIDKTVPFDVEFIQIRKILYECKKMRINAVRFTGGEPTLHPQLETLLCFAKEMGFYTMLNTNATFGIKDLNYLNKNVDNVLISLQGFNQETEGKFTRSENSFSKKMHNIFKLKQGIPIVRVGTVISKTLFNNYDKYFNLLSRIGIKRWELYRPINPVLYNGEYQITKGNLVRIMDLIQKSKALGMSVRIANPLPFCIIKNNEPLALSTLLGGIADDGHSRMVWDVKGYFKPSYFINKNLGTSIQKAWNSNWLKKIRSLEYLPIKCKNCYLLDWCKGGSRVCGYSKSQDYFSTDPLMS